MLDFLRRRKPEPVESLEPEHIVSPVGPNTYLHTFKAAPQTEAQRQAAEDAAIAEFDRSLAPAPRHPVGAPRRSIFDKFPPNGQSFPH
jgi:hypothetical protein